MHITVTATVLVAFLATPALASDAAEAIGAWQTCMRQTTQGISHGIDADTAVMRAYRACRPEFRIALATLPSGWSEGCAAGRRQ